jgi:DNA-binding response OmpR family regulator
VIVEEEGLLNKSILIVDDEPMARNLLRLMLKETGFVILEAEDGYDALEKAKANRPTLMILDVMMPGLDGLAVCRSLRADSELSDLPIVMLSARTAQKSIQDGLDAGADKYLTKPVGFKQLIGTIQEVLGESISRL